jgi:hypothetical protein
MERSWKHKWIDRFFDYPLWGRAVLLGILAGLLGFVLDEISHAFGYPWFYERLLENLIEGLVIGYVVYWLSNLRDRRLKRRVTEVGYMNHHIRNAMQAIELAVTNIADARQRLAVVQEAVARVTDTLAKITDDTDEIKGFTLPV